jgi:hypothetical protein
MKPSPHCRFIFSVYGDLHYSGLGISKNDGKVRSRVAGNILYSIGRVTHLFPQLKQSYMGNLLYVIAVILIIAWAIGFFGYHAGGVIHILLVIAIVAILLKVIRGSSI